MTKPCRVLSKFRYNRSGHVPEPVLSVTLVRCHAVLLPEYISRNDSPFILLPLNAGADTLRHFLPIRCWRTMSPKRVSPWSRLRWKSGRVLRPFAADIRSIMRGQNILGSTIRHTLWRDTKSRVHSDAFTYISRCFCS